MSERGNGGKLSIENILFAHCKNKRVELEINQVYEVW